eukprot:c19761_g1_i1.p1 GENE.c19761_g1_i1~~c19761_g1_i1.p1  ORF type:complete len:933 (-),score=266.29 c19761_g1_i1:98-2896(-)
MAPPQPLSKALSRGKYSARPPPPKEPPPLSAKKNAKKPKEPTSPAPESARPAVIVIDYVPSPVIQPSESPSNSTCSDLEERDVNQPPPFQLNRRQSAGQDEYLIIGDWRLMFVQVLVQKQFTGQTAGTTNTAPFSETRVGHFNFDERMLEIHDKGALQSRIEFDEMIGHSTEDHNPKRFHIYRTKDYRWTFEVHSLQDVKLTDALLYTAEARNSEEYRLKNLLCNFSTKVLREDVLSLKTKSLVTSSYQDRFVKVLSAKLLIYKKAADKVPQAAISLYGAEFRGVGGSKDFEVVWESTVYTFRAKSREDAQDWIDLLKSVVEMGSFDDAFDIAPAELVTRVLHPELGHTIEDLHFDERAGSMKDMSGMNHNLAGEYERAARQAQQDKAVQTSRKNRQTPDQLDLVEEYSGILAIGRDENGTTDFTLRHVAIKGDRLVVYGENFVPPGSAADIEYYLKLQECILANHEGPLDVRGADGYTFPFVLKDFNEIHILVANTENDRHSWLEALQGSIGNMVLDRVGGEVRCGTGAELVDELVNPAQLDCDYVESFMYTFQTIMTPTELISEISDRFFRPYSPDQVGVSELVWARNIQRPVQEQCVRVLCEWLNRLYGEVCTDSDLLAKYDDFIEQCRDQHEWASSALQRSLREAKDKLAKEARGGGEQKAMKLLGMDAPEPRFLKQLHGHFSFLDCDFQEVARQMCLVEYEQYNKIRAVELMNQAWSRSTVVTTKANVERFIAQFNTISLFVVKAIVSAERLKDRTIVLGRVIQLGGALLYLQNYNSLKAVLAGLNMTPVYRLKHTKANLSKKALSQLQMLEEKMSAQKSHKAYRDVLRESDSPCIPFLGVNLTDLTFVGDGNPDFVEGNRHNFTKRRLAYGIIRTFTQFQGSPYLYQSVPQIQSMIFHDKLPSEEDLYQLSLKREPRGAKRSELML